MSYMSEENRQWLKGKTIEDVVQIEGQSGFVFKFTDGTEMSFNPTVEQEKVVQQVNIVVNRSQIKPYEPQITPIHLHQLRRSPQSSPYDASGQPKVV